MSKLCQKNDSKSLTDRKTSSAPKLRTNSARLKKLPPLEKGKSDRKTLSRAESASVESDSLEGIPSSTQDILKICQESDCLKILNIELHGYKLKKICDLTKFTRVQSLDVSGNFLTKIEGLDANQQLKQLKLYDNKISVLENLECLHQLQDLQLQFNLVDRVGPGLTALRNLSSLRLDNNKLTAIDAKELASVSKTLKNLDLSRNRLTDIAAVVSLKVLEELTVGGNSIKQLPSLKNLEKLIEFDCSDNQLTTLRGLENCNSMTTLIISRNKLKSDVFAQFHSVLERLDSLDAEENRIATVDGLCVAFPNLSVLNLSKNEIREPSSLLSSAPLERLAEIDLRNNLVSLDPARLCEAFTCLEMVDGRPLRGSGVMIPKEPLMIHPVGARMEQQMREFNTTLSFGYEDMLSRFKSIRQNMDSDLPNEKPDDDERPSSKCRGRLEQAKKFSETNYRE